MINIKIHQPFHQLSPSLIKQLLNKISHFYSIARWIFRKKALIIVRRKWMFRPRSESLKLCLRSQDWNLRILRDRQLPKCSTIQVWLMRLRSYSIQGTQPRCPRVSQRREVQSSAFCHCSNARKKKLEIKRIKKLRY